jgi:hypothetical protein
VPPELRNQPSYPLWGTVTKHPSQGELHVDIYDIGTGRKAIALQGAFRNLVATAWPGDAFFLEDSYFFLNSGTTKINQFWLCALPGAVGAPNGKVRASVKAKEIDVFGSLQGNVDGADKIYIRNGARFVGDIHARGIVIEDGGFIRGKVDLSHKSGATA